MNFKDLLNSMMEELSGERTKRMVEILSTYHRIQASSGLLSAIKVIQKELKVIGDQNCKIIEYIADGKKRYYDWNTPFPWEIKDGFLKLIEPEEKILCRFTETPVSIATHSKSVDIIAEIVDIGEGKEKDFKDKDIKGKIVLTSGSPRSLIERMHKNEAIGILGYPTEQRAAGHAHLIQYLGIWPNAENVDKSSFGFSLSRKQALELLNHLKRGKKVEVHAKIDAKLEPGKMQILSTMIEGTKIPEEEIILIAHICHPSPSANDNASGSALLLEVFRTIFELIKQSKLPPPERSLRFLWVPEFNGSLPWIENQSKKETWKPQFCINLDMVGEHPAIIGEPFTVHQASITTPFYLNDVINCAVNLIKDNRKAIEQGGWQHPWNYRFKSFSGGSDHVLFNDEPTRIPAVMFGHNDQFWHTNLDTVEKVDATELKRVGLVTTISAVLSAYTTKFSTIILNSFISGHLMRKGQFLEMITTEFEKHENNEEQEQKLAYYIMRHLGQAFIVNEKIALNSIKMSFGKMDNNLLKLIEDDIESFLAKFETIKQKIPLMEISEKLRQELIKIPIRKWNGPIDASHIYRVLSDEEKELKTPNFEISQIERIKSFIRSSSFGGTIHEIVNLINGKRTISDLLIYHSLSSRKISHCSTVLDFLKLMKLKNLIEFK